MLLKLERGTSGGVDGRVSGRIVHCIGTEAAADLALALLFERRNSTPPKCFTSNSFLNFPIPAVVQACGGQVEPQKQSKSMWQVTGLPKSL